MARPGIEGPAAPRKLIQRGELLAALDRARGRSKGHARLGPGGQLARPLCCCGLGQMPAVSSTCWRKSSRYVATSRTLSSSGSPSSSAISRQASGTPGECEQLAATPDFNDAAIADRVLSELAEHCHRTFLIIDDLHELTSPEALTQLTRLLENLPGHVHAILATRRDLPLRLHCKLRLAGELAEIRAADLRFTENESRELLQDSGIVLSEAGVAKLHQRAERLGCRSAKLAAISLATSPDPERFVAEFSGSSRTVASNLLAEMLECPAGRSSAATSAHVPSLTVSTRRTGRIC